MRNIDGIEDVLASLEPHWAYIEDDFNTQNERYLAFAATDHDVIGRVLRAHLIVENFLNPYLADHLSVDNFDGLRFSFHQKASLLPSEGVSAAFVKPGILQLNRIRNKFGHRLDFTFQSHEISAIYEVLQVARGDIKFATDVEAIEAFAPIACAFLAVPPKGLEKVFMEAFTKVRSFPPE